MKKVTFIVFLSLLIFCSSDESKSKETFTKSNSQNTSPSKSASKENGTPQKEIKHYDNIELGINKTLIIERIKKLSGIVKIDGINFLEQIPESQNYRYAISRGDSRNSEVELYFENGKLSKIIDISGGTAVNTIQSATATFAKLKSDLSTIWGSPTQVNSNNVVWQYNNITATLLLEKPSSPYGLPNLTITVE